MFFFLVLSLVKMVELFPKSLTIDDAHVVMTASSSVGQSISQVSCSRAVNFLPLSDESFSVKSN